MIYEHIDIYTFNDMCFSLDLVTETIGTLHGFSPSLMPVVAPGQRPPTRQTVLEREQITGATPLDIFKKAYARAEAVSGANITRTVPSSEELFGQNLWDK